MKLANQPLEKFDSKKTKKTEDYDLYLINCSISIILWWWLWLIYNRVDNNAGYKVYK